MRKPFTRACHVRNRVATPFFLAEIGRDVRRTRRTVASCCGCRGCRAERQSRRYGRAMARRTHWQAQAAVSLHDNWTNGMEYAKRFRDAYAKEYAVPGTQVNAVLAAHGKTGAMTFNDAAWDKYEIGQAFRGEGQEEADLRRNIFSNPTRTVTRHAAAIAAGVTCSSAITRLPTSRTGSRRRKSGATRRRSRRTSSLPYSGRRDGAGDGDRPRPRAGARLHATCSPADARRAHRQETVRVFFRRKSIRMNWPSVIVFVK